jgi:hypothetical protein
MLSLLVFIAKQQQLFAQTDPQSKYLRKVEAYRKMKNGGTVLGVAGAALTITGIVLVSKADWHQQSYVGSYGSNYNTDGKGVAGIFSIALGVPMTVGGIVLGSIGSRKMKQYQEKLSNVRFNLLYTPQQRGMTLAYRF